jgi:hypothetical protein
MNDLRYTLLSDGSSDRALIPLLTWLLREHHVECAIQAEWADLRRLPSARRTLADRIKLSLELYPCDLLFVHRDAEKEPHQVRITEIHNAVNEAAEAISLPPIICVVPVHMQEAWLLFNESAIRRAAGNPHGRQRLNLPRLDELERLPDPKHHLQELLREASGLSGRRRKKLLVSLYAQRVLELIDDFAPLRRLAAFNALEGEARRVIEANGWSS